MVLKGSRHSNETKLMMSLVHTGKIISNDHKLNISKARKGKKHTEESKLKMSLVRKGRHHSSETKVKMSKNHKGMLGKTHSKIARKRMKESNTRYWLGKNLSEEHKRKIGLANKGNKHSEEVKLKISKSLKDKKHSEKTKLKIKEGMKNSNKMWKDPSYREKVLSKTGYGIKGKFYSDKTKQYIFYASNLELAAYKLLEQLNQVKYYFKCLFSINYKMNNKLCLYIPDILVVYKDNTKEVVEIKPEYKLLERINQAKFEAAKIYCNNNNLKFSVWTEKELNMFKYV